MEAASPARTGGWYTGALRRRPSGGTCSWGPGERGEGKGEEGKEREPVESTV